MHRTKRDTELSRAMNEVQRQTTEQTHKDKTKEIHRKRKHKNKEWEQ